MGHMSELICLYEVRQTNYIDSFHREMSFMTLSISSNYIITYGVHDLNNTIDALEPVISFVLNYSSVKL